jgi:hypothetical protein
MNIKQILFTVIILAAVSAPTMVASVMAQNMTGGNITGGNMTDLNMTGGISGYEEDVECAKSPACMP